MNKKTVTQKPFKEDPKKEEEYKIIAHWIYEECNSPIGEIQWLLKQTDEILGFSDDSVRDNYEEVLIKKYMNEQTPF